MNIPEKFKEPLEEAMLRFDISTPRRRAAFLANVIHESGNFRYMTELWGREPTKWQAKYEGHVGLGNTHKGDGYRFRGRGPIQITGRANYRDMTNWIREVMPDAPDFEQEPELLATPQWGCMAAACWWQHHHCNACADSGEIQKTRRIVNGPKMLGLAEVKKYYAEILNA
jgi:putative chitinase